MKRAKRTTPTPNENPTKTFGLGVAKHKPRVLLGLRIDVQREVSVKALKPYAILASGFTITSQGKEKPPASRYSTREREHVLLRLRRALSSSADSLPAPRFRLRLPKIPSESRRTLSVLDLLLAPALRRRPECRVGYWGTFFNLRAGRSLPQGEEVTARTMVSGRCGKSVA